MNWVFPEKIGEFSLVGIPTDLNGTVDVDGYYAREAKGVRTVVAVSVYPLESAQPETTPGQLQGHRGLARDLEEAPSVAANELLDGGRLQTS